MNSKEFVIGWEMILDPVSVMEVTIKVAQQVE
jgi:hypothetical protein